MPPRKTLHGSKPSRGTKSRRPGKPARTREAARLAEVERLRARMDDLNRELLRRIERRVELAVRIGRAKAGLGWPVADPAREREMLARTLGTARGGTARRGTSRGLVPRAGLERILRALFAVSRRAVERDRRSADARPRRRAGRRRS